MEMFEIGSRRRCDNDGKLYTVRTRRHRFCSERCRAAFHRYGTPYLQLRPLIAKEIDRALTELECRIFSVLDSENQLKYRRRFPERYIRLELEALAAIEAERAS